MCILWSVLNFAELELPTKTTPGTMYKNTNTRQTKKISNSRKKTNRRPNDVAEGAAEGNYVGNNDFGTTQVMGGITQEGQRTERPLTIPSLSPPWVILNSANTRRPLLFDITILHLLILSAILVLWSGNGSIYYWYYLYKPRVSNRSWYDGMCVCDNPPEIHNIQFASRTCWPSIRRVYSEQQKK